MKKLFLLVFVLINIFYAKAEGEAAITITADNVFSEQAMPLLIVTMDDNPLLRTSVAALCTHFNNTGRFVCTHEMQTKQPHYQHEIRSCAERGYALLVLLDYDDVQKKIEWRLYDTLQGIMIKGKRYSVNITQNPEILGRALAHHIWQVLTNTHSSFLSKIIYTLKKRHKKALHTAFYITDYEGSNAQLWQEHATICINPCWHPNTKNPLIGYSEFTATNVRLMAQDFNQHHFMMLDKEGTCVGVSWSADGKTMVYCHSGKLWNCSYDVVQKKWVHTCVVQEKEPCASPILLANNDIVYCGEGKIKCYRQDKQITEFITEQGYCVAPAHCPATKKLVYSKRVGGYMQLFLYDDRKKRHRQLTYDKADKTDATWSPCGTFLAFCYDKGINSRIGILNIITGKISLITPEHENCGYPAWSPAFDYYLQII
ncbi:MAG: hypothetical protein WA432_02830 [Candidatus Babeliaceae bacterium]